MPTTPKGITYPSNSSPVAVPADLQELATDVDGLLVPNTGGTYTGAVSFTQSPSVPTPTSGLHAVNKTYADAINADVTALETELGSNPSGTFSTVVQRLDSYTDGFNKVGNLLTANQASAESGATTGWSSTNATFTASTDRAVDGTYSFKLVTTSDTTVWMGHDAGVGNYTPVTAGETYTATVDWYVPSTNTGTIGSAAGPIIYWYTAAGVYVSDTGINVLGAPPEDAWTTRKVTAVAPATAAYARLFPIYTASSYLKANDVVYIDRVGLWKGASGRWAMPGVPIPGQSRIAVNNAVDLSGTGSPEGVVVAAPGSTYLQTGSVTDVKGWIRWIKATGTSTTGWIAGPEADTGWRNVTALMESAFKTSNPNFSLVLRRVGSRVTYACNETVAGSATGTVTIYNAPAGFRETVSNLPQYTDLANANTGGGTHETLALNANTLYGFGWTAIRHVGHLTFDLSTGAAWPSSLPGSAA